MAIEKLLSLIILIFVCTANAQAETQLDLIKNMQLYLDKNQFEKVEDLYDENEDELKKNGMALESLALSFERRNKTKEAIDIYRRILISIYPNENKAVFSSSSEKLDESIYKKIKLPFYYYKLAFLYTQLYFSSNDYTGSSEKLSYKKRAESFIGLCKKTNCDEAELKLLTEQLNEKDSIEKSREYKSSWFVVSDLISWQDNVILIKSSTNVASKLLTTNVGLLLGVGKKWQNNKYEFNWEAGVIQATSTVSSANTAVGEYQQSSVVVTGVYTAPGMYFKTSSESVQLGVSIPMMIRKGDWEVPIDYRFENATQFSAGLLLQSKLKIGPLVLRTRIGKQFPNPSLFGSLGLIYDF